MLTMTGTVKILSIKVKVMSHIVSIMNYVAYDFLNKLFYTGTLACEDTGIYWRFSFVFFLARAYHAYQGNGTSDYKCCTPSNRNDYYNCCKNKEQCNFR